MEEERESVHSSTLRMNMAQSPVELAGSRGGKLRLAHYKGSLVIVKPFLGDVPPTVSLLDKEEMTAVRYTRIYFNINTV